MTGHLTESQRGTEVPQIVKAGFIRLRRKGRVKTATCQVINPHWAGKDVDYEMNKAINLLFLINDLNMNIFNPRLFGVVGAVSPTTRFSAVSSKVIIGTLPNFQYHLYQKIGHSVQRKIR